MPHAKQLARTQVKQQWPQLDWPSLNEAVVAYIGKALDEALARLALPADPSVINLLTYMPIRGEMDLTPAYPGLLASGYRLWLPRVTGEHLAAGAYHPETLIPGPYGIREPAPPYTDDRHALCPLILLIPCLAINGQGYRLGRGKGYYDRLLQQLTGLPFISIGVCPVAFGGEAAPAFETDPWDQPLHGWLSETGIKWFP
jgi:5-formyltetrahydrofolate cyclo-ligase